MVVIDCQIMLIKKYLLFDLLFSYVPRLSSLFNEISDILCS